MTVTDDGCGIEPEELDRIFERFHRASSAPGRTRDGSGLGLYVARKIVEAHAGRLAVESVLGEGSRFTLPTSRGPRDAARRRKLTELPEARSRMSPGVTPPRVGPAPPRRTSPRRAPPGPPPVASQGAPAAGSSPLTNVELIHSTETSFVMGRRTRPPWSRHGERCAVTIPAWRHETTFDRAA